MKNPHVIWASVTIIFLLLAGTVVLSVFDKDVTVILSLGALVAIPVLSAFGVAIYQKMDQVKEASQESSKQVKEASNGSQDKLLAMIQELQTTVTGLALQVKPPEAKEEPWKDEHT